MMKKQLLFFAAAIFFSTTISSQWTQKANFGGTARRAGVGFSIGTKGYIGLGDDGNSYVSDFWEYNPTSNSWTQKAVFPGGGRIYATGFSIGTYGYVGTGDLYSGQTKDLWEYNQSNNTWTKKTDLAGLQRTYALSFSIGTKGYLGSGSKDGMNFIKDIWQYDPSSNSWTQKADLITLTYRATAFTINSKGYVIDAGNLKTCEYDPTANTWKQKANFPGTDRIETAGFSIGSKGYVGTGYKYSSDGYFSDFWEYNPSSDTWSQKTNFPGAIRADAVGFSIGSKGYLGTGTYVYNMQGTFYKDFWEYTPTTGISEASLNNKIKIRYGGNSVISVNADMSLKEISVYNLAGEQVLKINANHQNSIGINIASLQKGIYLVNTITEKGQSFTGKIFYN